MYICLYIYIYRYIYVSIRIWKVKGTAILMVNLCHSPLQLMAVVIVIIYLTIFDIILLTSITNHMSDIQFVHTPMSVLYYWKQTPWFWIQIQQLSLKHVWSDDWWPFCCNRNEFNGKICFISNKTKTQYRINEQHMFGQNRIDPKKPII